MNKSKQEWEAGQRVKNPAISQQELDTQWKSLNPGWAQSLAGSITRGVLHPVDSAGAAFTDISKATRLPSKYDIKIPDPNNPTPKKQEQPQSLSSTVNQTSVPTESDPANFAKAPEETAPTNTSETSEIVNSITPPAGKTEVIPPSQAEKSLRAATQAYNSIQYKAPESTTKDLRSKLEEAYNSKITRNDWAELATTLANAVAQYGSAHQAGDKYSGGIKFAPGVDYGARSDRAFREYSRATDAADKIDAAKERGSLQEHQSKMDVLRGKTDLAKLDVDMERERARTAAASQSELGKMTDREKETSRREDAATERSSAETKVDRETISKMDQYRNLSKAIQDAKGTAKDRLISQRAKLSTGLSADQEAAAIAGAEKSRGLFNPFTPESSPESEQAALDAAIAQQKAVVGSRIASRQGGAVQPPASSTGKTDQQPVTVKHKSTGQTRQFPAGSVELQNALQNPEFEIVR